MALQEIGWEGVDWINLVLNRNLGFQNAENFLNTCGSTRLSSRILLHGKDCLIDWLVNWLVAWLVSYLASWSVSTFAQACIYI